MQFNPLTPVIRLYASDPDGGGAQDSDLARAGKFAEEAGFFMPLFQKQVRPEDVAPFLWRRHGKAQDKKCRQAMRRVNKKKGAARLLFYKRDHEPACPEGAATDYI